MNIKKNITINLTEGDVKDIIADYCYKNGYNVTGDDITLSVGTRSVGYYMDEHDEVYFAGAKVHVRKD